MTAERASPFDRYAALSAPRRRLLFDQLAAQQADRLLPPSAALAARGGGGRGKPGISLLFFSNRADQAAAHYEVLLAAAQAADRDGLEAIWLPERHFNDFGGPYPNPALLSAAVAARTSRLGIRAGSVVLPLHQPVRVVEDWSVVDNLSGGRVGIAAASGWQPSDFRHLGAANLYDDRRAETLRRVDLIDGLWRRRALDDSADPGLRLLPRPVQPILPMWLTASRNQATWQAAADRGTGVLSALLEQSREELFANIAAYRRSLAQRHSPAAGRVTLMMHGLLGADPKQARSVAETALQSYFLSHLDLYKGFIRRTYPEIDVDGLSDRDQKALVSRGAARYLDGNALVGSIHSVLETCQTLSAGGVDEIACLVDFHEDSDVLMETIHELGHLVGLLAAPDAG